MVILPISIAQTVAIFNASAVGRPAEVGFTHLDLAGVEWGRRGGDQGGHRQGAGEDEGESRKSKSHVGCVSLVTGRGRRWLRTLRWVTCFCVGGSVAAGCSGKEMAEEEEKRTETVRGFGGFLKRCLPLRWRLEGI